MCSLRTLEESVKATQSHNRELHETYREHCRVVELLLALLTHNPRGSCGLPGQLSPIYLNPHHQLPCSSTAAYAWCTEVGRALG